MAKRIVVRSPDGNREYMMFNDNVELAMAYRNKAVAVHDEVVYRGMICEIVGEFADEDGVVWPELLFVMPVMQSFATV